jgi:tRNA (cmo5U34)-methyltransferase
MSYGDMKEIRKHFEEEAKEFDEIIIKLIPFYNEMINGLVLSIPFDYDERIRVIDLGCGTGTIASKVKEKFKNAHITCLDLAENMISMAKAKLEEYDDVQYLINDFYNFKFDKTYDVVISSLALHHLINDEDKKKFYKKIFNSLTDRGVFYNADVVLGSNNTIQKINIKQWIEFMERNVPKQEIETKWIQKYNEEDRPAKLIDQIKWLEHEGFKDVDVIWKYYNFAVYGGYKYSR